MGRAGQPPPSYAVLRFEGWPEAEVPAWLEGLWLEVPDPRTAAGQPTEDGEVSGVGAVHARPTGRFEVRDWDGAVAEVWAVARPANDEHESELEDG